MEGEKVMDPLSDVLSLLKPRTYMVGGFDVGGEISIQFGKHEGIKCYAVVSGECWLDVDGVAEPVLLKEGDCFLLSQGRPFRMATDLSQTPVDAMSFLTEPANGRFRTINGGGRCVTVGGYFSFAGCRGGILLGVLPPIVHIRKESDRAAMRWSLERMMEELREPQPGGVLVAQQLAYLMLVQALRLHLTQGLKGGVGWLFALADPKMSAAMAAMHGEPGHRWTLQELAERVGMSRSTFALRFKETVGKSPMEYLTKWRMLMAAERMESTGDSVGEIAGSVGYESESAFSTAFKRVMGVSPRGYGRGGGEAKKRVEEMELAAG